MRPFFFHLIGLLFFLSTNTYAQKNISGGDVFGTWTVDDSPYLIEGNITVPNDSLLVIEPGVKVEFQGYYSLDVQGCLLAEGTENDSILFTVSDTTGFSLRDTTLGGWNGIQFFDTPLDNDTSRIVYCKIQYGKAVGSNHPDKSGGAICISNFSKVLLSDCLITNNSAGGSDSPSGGAICLNSADIILKNNTISQNQAWDGGGVQIWESNPVFIKNQIVYNSADAGGGGIWIGGQSDIQFNGDVISNNTAKTNGGGIVCWQTTKTTLKSVTLKNNVANWGAGIGILDCELHADSCSFVSNGSVEMGGGFGAYSSKVDITNTNFENNTASIFGGALKMYNTELTLESSDLTGNVAGVLGGGIHADYSNLIVSNTTFERDSAGNSGGGLFIWKGKLDINNGVLINNKSKYSGGAIYTDSTTMTINNSSFVQNTTTDNGGAIFLNLSAATHINKTGFEQNKAIWGGGIFSAYGGLNLYDCSFIENSSEHGGAVNFGFGEGEFKNVSFLRNSGIWGGGVTAANCDIDIDSCLFSQNTAGSEAGAIEYFVDTTIFERSYKFKLRKTDIIENIAAVRCGAVKLEQTGSDFSMADITIDSCQIFNNHSDVYGSLRISGSFEDFVVSNSIFKSNTSNRYTSGPGFISNSKGQVFNCIFYSNYSQFSDTTKTFQGASVQTAEVDFLNCTFIDTSSAEGTGLSIRRGAKANIINCILWECGNSPINIMTTSELGSTANINYCDIENGIDSINISDTISVLNWGEGNIATDPLFVDMKNANLHLLDASPCIGSGISTFMLNDKLFIAPPFDIEGNQRPSPNDSEVDMGAYEHERGNPVGSPFMVEDKTMLYQNYPNPVGNSTTFKYHLDSPCYAELNIYNIFGQKIQCIVARKHSAGTYIIKKSINQFKTGQYFFQLRTNKGFVQTRKLIVVK